MTIRPVHNIHCGIVNAVHSLTVIQISLALKFCCFGARTVGPEVRKIHYTDHEDKLDA